MNPEEIKQMLAQAAREAAEQATKALEARQQAEAEAKALEAARQAEIDARVKAAVQAQIEVGQSGSEKLLAEVEKRLQAERDSNKSVLQGLEAALKEKAAELEAIQRSKMTFADSKPGEMSYQDKEKAVLLAKMAGKSIESTRFGAQMVEKYTGSQPGAHLPSATWETEVSLNMENEVRRRLVVAPTLRGIAMQTNVMKIPLNPEATVASWVQNSQWGSSASAGNNQTHGLKEITLSAYKVATNEYVAFEEEEDALLAIMPVIRDAMVRRVARAVDRAMLRGAGAGADPVKGLSTYDASSQVTLDISNADKLTVATLRSLRRDLGAWGLDPAEVIYVVSTDGYYDLLDDESFQTMDKVGSQATILTGQIGTVANSPVLVSAEFEDKAAGTVGAIAYAPMNFLVGNQRGLRVDTQDLVETQRRVMVASLRTGMTQVTTNNGDGVSALRYIA
jgi:HK97 family phage major capsid protein